MRGPGRKGERRPLVVAGLVGALLLLAPLGGTAQGTMERTPNLSGGWVGEPGALHFNVLHRFWVSGDNLVNSPTILLAVPLPGRLVAGAQYGSNSGVVPGRFNEWEAFGRWAPLEAGTSPVEVALTGAYNSAARSADAEVSAALPLGRLRLLGAARGFSDVVGSDAAGWSVGGGASLRLRPSVALSGDLGSLWIDGDREGSFWGVGLQLRIPTTPHTLSVQATNTRTGTVQGSSVRDRTMWGFEFTVPVTFARYIRRAPSPPPEEEVMPREGTVEVTMTDDLLFAPDTIEVAVGTTVVWRNTTPLMHTVTADPDAVPEPGMVSLPEGAEPFDSGEMWEDDVFEHTFTEPGEYHYVCVPHLPVMVGTIRVVP